jgi:small conductance mechanosensitive channel
MFEKVASESPVVEKTLSLAPTDLLRQEIDQVSYIYNIIVNFFANYTFQLIGAFIIFALGYIVAGKISNVVLRLCTKHKLDITLSQFLASTTKMLIVIMITITVRGVTGIVKEVLLAYTIIHDQDGVAITIPNKHIVGEILHNSKHDSLLELTVGIAYKEDPLQVVTILEKTIEELNIVGESREPQIGISEFADSSINISIRLWTPTANYYDAKFKAYKAIYLALKENNIEIPFPQHDVHLISQA